MRRVVYFSSQSYPFSQKDLYDLYEECRLNNLKNKITGILIYKDGSFCQVLEGEGALLDDLVQKIQNDRRHRNLIVLDYRSIQERRFDDWSMVVENMDRISSQTRTLSDVRQYLRSKFQSSEERDPLPHMLAAFTEQVASVAV